MKIIFESEKEKKALCKGLGTGVVCPSELNLDESCNKNCVGCWKRALRNMEVKEKDYRKDAESMIRSGRVTESEFFDILVDELAKKLEEDDKNK